MDDNAPRGGPRGDERAAGSRDRTLSDPTDWPMVTRETRPWTRWWWMASAVDPGNLERELSRLDEVGIGGVEVTPIYGVEGEEHRALAFLSDEWLDAFEHMAAAAAGRGMGVDAVPGTGWHYGGPSVGFRDSAMTFESDTADLDPGESYEASFDPDRIQTVVAYGDERTVELTDAIDDSGDVAWSAPEDAGEWRVYAVSGVRGRDVKRASPDREGPMVSPYYPEAMARYLRRFDGEFADYDGPSPRAVFHDSFEYDASWSPRLLESFERERGYRLQDHLPELLGEHPDEERVGRVKADYRRTLSGLYAETITTWTRWAHRHGWDARLQAHMAPGNILELYALADVPETEFIGDRRNLLGAKFASSAAHTAGKRLVSAETATWLDEHFTTTLAEIKAHVDRLFLAGVNHVVYHGTAYTPDDAPWPGWLFYASTQLNDRNPIWRDLPALNEYVTRCQSVLQFGDPDADLLLYWPVEDRWHDPEGLAERLLILEADWFEAEPFGRAARWLWERGYSFDYASDRGLSDAAVRDGTVELPGGEYRAVVVPEAEHLSLETADELLGLAGAGATVAFQGGLPNDVPGFDELERRRGALRERLGAVALGEPDGTGLRKASHGDGTVLAGDLGELAPETGARREPLVESGLQFERRSFDGGTHYFVVNTADDPFDGWASLAADGETAVALDPMTGEVARPAVRSDDDGRLDTRLQLEGKGSVILRVLDGAVDAPEQRYWTAAGEPTRIDGPWTVEFIRGGPERPPAVEMDGLRSWTEAGDTHRRFAGTARYAASFDRPDGEGPWWLDLGTVHESARVWLNGHERRTLITPPYRLPVEELAPTDNDLVVEVTNLAANRVRDLDRRGVDWKRFGDINLVNNEYEPFDASEWPARPAGLLGPVELVARRPSR